MEKRTETVKDIDITVVGSNMIDLISKIPHLPKMGETLIGSSFHLGFGGKGANQAVMAARLHAKVSMVAKVGGDIFGKMVRENFEHQGISTEFVSVQNNSASGVAPILVDDMGRNIVIIVPGANMDLTPNDVQRAAESIRRSKIVISQLEIPDEAIHEAFSIARSAGVLTILNPAPARQIPQETLSLTDILVPNEVETDMLTGISIQGLSNVEAASKKLHLMGAKQIIITLGENGTFYWDGKSGSHFPASLVTAIDSTGAGDAFIGSLAYALSTGKSMDNSIRFANQAAALSVTRIGTQTSFPTMDEIISHFPTIS